MLQNGESWVGPFQIRKLLETAFNAPTDKRKPPAQGSAYLVTRRGWRGDPKPASVPLYVGGITGRSHRFRTGIGDLLADAFGFYTESTGHSSGGQSLHEWCCQNGVNALDLYIAWVRETRCHRCLEVRLHHILDPELNRVHPSRCARHKSKPATAIFKSGR
jgi:hypothetical protein